VTPADNCDAAPTCDCTFVDAHDPDRFTWRRLGDCQFGVTLLGTTTVTATCWASDQCGNDSDTCSFDINAVCGQACSPGFWRNNLEEWCDYTPFQPISEPHPDACFGRGDATLFLDAFGIGSCQPAIDAGSSFTNGTTLYKAVNTSGGANQTLFHCTAALLSSYSMGFPADIGTVEAVIQDACTGSTSFDGDPVSWRRAFIICRDWNAVEYTGGCCPFSDPDCPLPPSPSITGTRAGVRSIGAKGAGR
jgi:hypothetical protein